MARVVTQPLLDALRVTFSKAFTKGETEAPIVGAALSTPVPSTTAINTYGWLGSLPIFRKWVGAKRAAALSEKKYQLINEDYEATLPIHKNQIADDEIGLYPAIFEGWGKEGKQWMDRLRFQALGEGHLRECYDGQNFFDTDHPQYDADESTWSNNDTTGEGEAWFLVDLSQPLKPLIAQERTKPFFWWVNSLMDSKVAETGIMTAYGEARGAVGYTLPFLAYRSTKHLTPANLKAAIEAMAAFKDDNLEPRGIRATHIVTGASNHEKAREAMKANLAGGETNTMSGRLIHIEADRLP